MSSAVAMKVKAVSTGLTKNLENLEKLCDKLNLKVCDIKQIRDGFHVIFNNEIDCKKLFDTNNYNVLINFKFEPLLPNESKSARSMLLKKLYSYFR